MAVVLLIISMGLFIVEKYWLERKSVATLTGKASRERMAISDRSVRIPLVTLCVAISLFVIVLYVLVGAAITVCRLNGISMCLRTVDTKYFWILSGCL